MLFLMAPPNLVYQVVHLIAHLRYLLLATSKGKYVLFDQHASRRQLVADIFECGHMILFVHLDETALYSVLLGITG